MMSWLLCIAVGLGLAGLVTALMHQPGVWLYDWIATRARRFRPAVRAPLPDAKREPLTQT
ncbi:hypothetical protein [Achromobacter spanius]|uniref:hypothetical protein n=1 Tax=Achromobacter spanius TaxID=217203 RepID=UPI0038219625